MIRTERLDLVAATPALARADIAGREALAEELGVGVPTSWPPELFDADAIGWSLARMEASPRDAGWWFYYVIEREPVPTLAGIVGYKGPPDAEGTVEVGYSVLPRRRWRGIATEATEALLRYAFARPNVRRVIGETLPELAPSVGVLEKLGFVRAGDGSEPGVIRFALDRAAFEASQTDALGT